MSELIPVTFSKIIQSRSYTVIILESRGKKFAIYTEPQVGHNIQIHLTATPLPRPYTHDLLSGIFKGFEIKILQIVINDIEDTIYFARLFLEKTSQGKREIIEIDARPSDCIILSVMNHVPILCHADILEKAVAVED